MFVKSYMLQKYKVRDSFTGISIKETVRLKNHTLVPGDQNKI